MNKFRKINFLVPCATIFFGLAACTTLPEVKTVHGDPAEQTSPPATAPVATTPAPTTPAVTAVPPKTEQPKPNADLTAFINKQKPMTEAERTKYAYELGLDPKNVMTDEDHLKIQKRRIVRNLERTLDSQKERLNYSKVLPWLQNDDEKIGYLSIPTIEGRQAWVNKNKIWLRNQNLKDYEAAVESQDIVLGMPADFVKRSWGEPTAIESSGNPIYKNERWKYLKQVSTPNGYHQEKRFVYLEGGRVVGWETE